METVKLDHNYKEIARELKCAFLIPRNHFYLLYILGPVWRVTQSHKYTVGQNSAHNDHAKYCRKESRENTQNLACFYPQEANTFHIGYRKN